MIPDLSTMIIGGILMIAIFGPLVYLAWKGKKRSQKPGEILKQVEKEQALNFNDHENWNDKAIGFDPVNKKLIFIDLLSHDQNWRIVDLSKATHCKTIDSGDVIQIQIEKRTMAKKPEIDILTLFNTKIDDPIERGYHITLAKKWVQKMESSILKKKNSTQRVA